MYKKGTRLAEPDVVLIYTPARSVRVGFSVSNKVGKAVVRNKVKRRLRASVQTLIPSMRGCQAIVVANPTAAGKPYDVLDGQLRSLLKRAQLIG